MAVPRRTVRIRVLARVAALAAAGVPGNCRPPGGRPTPGEAALARAFRAAEREGVPLRAIRETLLQVCLFAGFPRTVNALDALERALGPRASDPPERGERRFRARGAALFRRVYGADADRVLGDIGRRHPEFAEWIVREAYGRVLGRPGLSAAERECLAVALLATLDLPRQQVAHVRGALRCGATREEVSAAIGAVRGIASAAAIRFARGRLASV